MFAVGEGNFKSVNIELIDGKPTQTFELENSSAYPKSTQFCIEERIKEYNTAKKFEEINKDVATGKRPPGMSDKKWKELLNESNHIEKIDFDVQIDISNCDDNAIRSYRSFASDVKRKYGINVKLKS